MSEHCIDIYPPQLKLGLGALCTTVADALQLLYLLGWKRF